MSKNKEQHLKSDQRLDAWNISEQDFPSTGSKYDKLKFFLNYAILAPSSHNTQPWLFKIADNSVELYADRTRALPVVDPEDRELTISCGAALYHLLLTIRHFGYEYKLEVLPLIPISQEKVDSDLLAGYKFHLVIRLHHIFYASEWLKFIVILLFLVKGETKVIDYFLLHRQFITRQKRIETLKVS